MVQSRVSEIIENSPGAEIHQELSSIQISLKIQEDNYSELVDLHMKYQNYSIQEWQEKDIFEVIKSEYFRPFHNYVASIYTVTKHSQRIVNNYGDDSFYEEYTNEIFERDLHKHGEFLRQLRHYTQKRKVPPLATHFEFENTSEVDFQLETVKNKLLEWSGWNSDAKKYLKELDEQVPLLDIIKRYQRESEKFNDWFLKYSQYYFSEELNDLLERVIIADKMKKFLPDPTTKKQQKPTLHGYRTEESVTFPSIPKKYIHPYEKTDILI